MRQISISFIKITLASLMMGILSKLSFDYLVSSGLSQNNSLLIAITIGAVLYFLFVSLMKIKDIDVVVGEIKKKFTR
jgi:putative peptidoglycan lipid II flippase